MPNGERRLVIIITALKFVSTMTRFKAMLLRFLPFASWPTRPFSDHYKFKYSVSTDGWTASSRFEKIMLTGSTIIKQQSPR